MVKSIPVVTIDGASGSGKGTVCLSLARELGWNLLDSGALYRVLAYAARIHHVAIDNEAALEVLAAHLDVQFVGDVANQGLSIVFEGQDSTDAIREESIGQDASRVASFPAVRLALLNRQRSFREAPGLVADGRDMGSVVFPDAPLKIFLSATPEIRAQRRHKQLQERGINVKFETLLDDLNQRDQRDLARSASPLTKADDAFELDTSNMSAEAVFQEVLRLTKQHIVA